MTSEMHQLTPAEHNKKPSYSTIAKWDENEVKICESDNELENDLPLEDLEFNGYDEELPNYENV
ncbi:17092_t:CDS:2 [Funneliformis caledonium]|uniref:17092_t:CDS:1 n=1 Tax=Funneliformis caledonium TaxID=1117310 RepID=A0A9N9A7G8_9GLOM|nr:17092_t:CDS:2 [Funneliformis caledonium]